MVSLKNSLRRTTAALPILPPNCKPRHCQPRKTGVVEDQATELDTTLEGYIEAIELPAGKCPTLDRLRPGAGAQRGDFEKAIADFTEAIRLNPKSAAAYVQRGYLRYIKGENADAIRDYTEAIRLDASDAYAYYGRGGAWTNLRQFDKARSDYSEAIRIDPDNADFYNERGNAWFNTGQYSGRSPTTAKQSVSNRITPTPTSTGETRIMKKANTPTRSVTIPRQSGLTRTMLTPT